MPRRPEPCGPRSSRGAFALKALAAFTGLAILWPHGNAAPADPRHSQIVACIVAIRAQLNDPNRAEFPNYLIDPAAFQRDENNAFEPIETFTFRAPNLFGGMVRANAYCAYDEAGGLAVADIEDVL